MTRFNNKVGGLTGLGFLFILLIFGFFVTLALSLFPIYLEYYNVTTSLQSLKDEKPSELSQRRNIIKLLRSRLDINDVTHVSNENISIIKNVNSTTVTIDYEVRRAFLGNVDVIVKFNDSVELTEN